MHHILILVLTVASCVTSYPGEALPKTGPKNVDSSEQSSAKQQQYPQFAAPRFDYGPVQGYPNPAQSPFSFGQKPLYPRVQPQFFYYGGNPGQPFLLNPGAPPGNFLVPQPQPQPQPGYDPSFGFGNDPQRPFFVAGYPKPAHIPPIEKDAEEIPTDPASIPPFQPKPKEPTTGRRPDGMPDRLETFNESPVATEADGLEEAEKKPNNFPDRKIKPGHRFFFLNGQELYPYQYGPYGNLQPGLKHTQEVYPQNRPLYPGEELGQLPYTHAIHDENALYSPVNPYLLPQAHPAFSPDYYEQPSPYPYHQPNIYPQNPPFTSHIDPHVYLRNPSHPQVAGPKGTPSSNIPGDGQNGIGANQHPVNLFKTAVPFDVEHKDGEKFQITVATKDFDLEPSPENREQVGSFRYQHKDDSDSVVIDAKFENEPNAAGGNRDNLAVRSFEPSISQAAPAAIALAGPGGVAAAGPRGTALVGKGGLAVSNPRATAVAGPKEEPSARTKSARIKSTATDSTSN